MKSRSTSLALFFLASLTCPGLAAPEDGQVRAGTADIERTGRITTIRQGSDRAIVDWRRFDIARGELVRFLQPTRQSVILNRVIGSDPSRLAGYLRANGQVFLLNPNGILFTPEARVDVGGLVASTLALSDEDFLSGSYRFEQLGPAGSVLNEGQLKADGYLVLAAPTVRNDGTLEAGTVALGAGERLFLALDPLHLVSFELSGDGSAVHSGFIRSDRVRLEGRDLEVDGSIRGSDLSLRATESLRVAESASLAADREGTIVVWSDGSAEIGGKLTAPQGFVETSSLGDLLLTAVVRAGEWLIDPANLTIVAGPPGPNEISNTLINDALNLGTNVTLDAQAQSGTDSGHIVQLAGAPILKTAGGAATLVMRAGAGSGSITLNDSISSSSGPLNVSLVAPGGDVRLQGDVLTNGGWFSSNAGGRFTMPSTFTLDSDGGGVTLTHGDDVSLGNTLLGSGSLAVTTSGDILVWYISSTDLVLLNAGGVVDEQVADEFADILAGRLVVDAGRGIGNSSVLDVGVDLYSIFRVSGDGPIRLASPGDGLRINRAFAANGPIELSAAGNLDLVSANSSQTLSLLTSHGGNISVGTVSASEIDIESAGTLEEFGPPDDPADLVAPELSLVTRSGIGTLGALEIHAQSLAATSRDGGGIDLLDLGGGIAVGAAASIGPLAGPVRVGAVQGNLQLSSLVTNDSVELTTSGAGNVVLDSIVAGGRVQIESAGRIQDLTPADTEPEIQADSLLLRSRNGIGTNVPLDVSVNRIEAAENTGTGSIRIVNRGGLSVDLARTVDGLIALTARDGDLSVTRAIAGGAGRALFLETETSGDIRVGSVIANSDLIDVQSAGSVLTLPLGSLTAGTLRVDASGSVDLDVQVMNLTLSAQGPVRLHDLGGGLVAGPVTSAAGIELLANGRLTAVNVVSATGDVLLSSPTGDVYVGVARALQGDITVQAARSIEEFAPDSQVDLRAQRIVLGSLIGIGEQNPLDVSASELSASTDEGDIHLSSTPFGPTRVSLSTGLGDLSLEQSGSQSLTVDQVEARLAEIDLRNPGGTLTVGNLSNLGRLGTVMLTARDILVSQASAGDVLSINASGTLGALESDAEADLVARNMSLTAARINALEIDATNLTASGTNGVNLTDTRSGLTVLSASSSSGDLSLTSTDGTLFVNSVQAGPHNVLLRTTTGALLLGAILVPGGSVTVESANRIAGLANDAAAPHLVAKSLDLTAAGGIGALQVDAETMTALDSGGGWIFVEDVAGGLTASASTAGVIRLTAVDGDLTAGEVAGGGNVFLKGMNVRCDAVSSQANLYVEASGRLEEWGADSQADLTGVELVLRSGGGIGLEVDAPTVTASASGPGDIALGVRGGDSDLRVNTALGSIALEAVDSSLTLTNVQAGGGGQTLEAVTTGSGDILVDRALALGGALELVAAGRLGEAGDDTLSDLVASTMALSAVAGISGLELNASTLSAQVTGPGDLALEDMAGGLTVASASTNDGAISLTARNGHLALLDVLVGGSGRDLQVSTLGSGDVTVDQVSAPDDEIVISSARSVQELGDDPGADLTASRLTLTTVAGAGTGIAGPLEIESGLLTATASGTGSFRLLDVAGGLTVTSAVTTDGSLNLTAVGGDLNLVSARAGGVGRPLTATTVGTGSIYLGHVAGDLVRLTSGGAVDESTPDGAADVVARSLEIRTVNGIGSAGPLEVNVETLAAARVSGPGPIRILDTGGGVRVSAATTTEGFIQLVANGGTLDVELARAGGADSNVILSTNVAGDIRLGLVQTPGRVVVNSVGSIGELNPDAGVDLFAGRVSELRAAGGTIGGSNALEVSVTGGALRVLATGGETGVSVRVDGLVSPSNTLILLNSPPGSVLFNGAPVF